MPAWKVVSGESWAPAMSSAPVSSRTLPALPSGQGPASVQGKRASFLPRGACPPQPSPNNGAVVPSPPPPPHSSMAPQFPLPFFSLSQAPHLTQPSPSSVVHFSGGPLSFAILFAPNPAPPSLSVARCLSLHLCLGLCLSASFCVSLPLCVCACVESIQSGLTLCDPMDCSPPGSSVHGILQARILEWIAMPFSRGSSQPRDENSVSYVSCIGRRVLYH